MATAKLYLDRPKGNGLHSVKIRISHLNDRKYYPTGEELTQKDFTLIEEAIKGKNLRRAEIIGVKKRLQSKLNSATEAINALNDRFSFLRYEEMLNTGKKMNDLESLFDAYIAQLKEDDRIGTALSEGEKEKKPILRPLRSDATAFHRTHIVDKMIVQLSEIPGSSSSLRKPVGEAVLVFPKPFQDSKPTASQTSASSWPFAIGFKIF